MTGAGRWIALVAMACACAVGQAAQSGANAPGSSPKASRQLVEQKEALVKRMLSDSPTARRIEASHNAEARGHLARAQEIYAKAALAIRDNDVAGADRRLNEAMALIGRARQLVPDPLSHNVEHRVRYAQMLESVESLMSSYQRHLQRRQRPGAAEKDGRLVQVTQLVDSAKSLANSEQIAQANKVLGEAEHTLMVGLSHVLGARTILYTQRFGTAAEEYGFELERNRSYADLIPIAIAEFKPASNAMREVQSLLDTNRELREQAQQQAARKEYRSALAALRRGTGHLQNALSVAGLRVPQESVPERVQR